MKSSIGIALFFVSFLLNQYKVEAACTVPAVPANGQIDGTAAASVAAAVVVTLTCNNAIAVTGEAAITCQADDSWSPAAFGTCTSACAALTAPADGTVSDTAVATGTTVTVACNEGFTLTGTASLTCTDGAWSAAVGTCGSSSETTTEAESDETTDSAEDSGSINPALNKLIIMNVIIAILGFMYI
ncbi:uncharacterized protein LOC144440172 [Glandiceps talaboti]